MLKILQARLQQYVNQEIEAAFRKGQGISDQIAKISGIIGKAKELQKNIYFCFIYYPKAFDCVVTTNWEILKRDETIRPPYPLLRNLYAGQEKQLEPDMVLWIGSKLGNEYVKAVYHHAVYLTYIEATSCEMSGWNHELESRLAAEISATSDMRVTPP